jgi:hypothetical protein
MKAKRAQETAAKATAAKPKNPAFQLSQNSMSAALS